MTDHIKTVIGDYLEHAEMADIDDVASGILAALKAARIAVVELPEPYAVADGVTYFGDGCCAASAVQSSPGVVYHDTWEYQPDNAREVGMYWLAAADAAEASQ